MTLHNSRLDLMFSESTAEHKKPLLLADSADQGENDVYRAFI